ARCFPPAARPRPTRWSASTASARRGGSPASRWSPSAASTRRTSPRCSPPPRPLEVERLRVFLTGFMGSGKTTVGRALGAALGWPFVDLDAEVEAGAAMTVREVFARRGEPAFRKLEHEALRQVLARP